MVYIRRIQPGDGPIYRAVRLESLLDAPTAFGSTAAIESGYSQADWEQWAGERSAGSDEIVLLALRDDEPDDDGHLNSAETIGLLQGCRLDDQPQTMEMSAMWVAPSHRRTATGTLLVETMLQWAADNHIEVAELWVARGNDRAEGFYRRLGFESTNVARPAAADPSRDELRMFRTVAGS